MSRITNVCICGGGRMGHALAAVCGSNPDVSVRVLTRRPSAWGRGVSALLADGTQLDGSIEIVTDDPSVALQKAQIILLAVPTSAREEVLHSIKSFVSTEAWIGSIPGFGGFDWIARSILGSNVRLFGLQRIPYVCGALSYGHSVSIRGIRPTLYVASHPARDVDSLARELQVLLQVRTVPMPNYLNVTLSPSNPIFNTARLYTLFTSNDSGDHDFTPTDMFADWTNDASVLLARLSDEVQCVCRSLPLDLGYVQPVVQLYEVAFESDLTRKIQGLAPLHGRPAPLRRRRGKAVPDWTSSYITEDVLHGLLPIRAIADICSVPTPFCDQVLQYFGESLRLNLLAHGRTGVDAVAFPIPQRFGVDTISKLIEHAVY